MYAEDENSSRSLLQQGGVDGQYVAQLFKWIKQHLRIKAFYGASENAVKIRDRRLRLCPRRHCRKRLALEASLYQILQILSVTLFEKTPILQALHAPDSGTDLLDPGNQLILFDF